MPAVLRLAAIDLGRARASLELKNSSSTVTAMSWRIVIFAGSHRAATGRIPGMHADLVVRASLFLRTGWRMLRVTGHFAWGWVLAVLVLPRTSDRARRALVQAWCVNLLQIAGVTVEETGRRFVGPVMLVSNHVSWLDMIAIQALCPTRFVAKSEVRAWPVIGTVATRVGTVYIDRQSSRSAAAVAGSLAGHLLAGEMIAIFPEGTTTDGTRVQPFRGSLLQAPIDARAMVQPVALTYRESDTGVLCRRASYSGDDVLLASIWRTVSARVTVRLAFGPALEAGGQDRRSLARSLHSKVEDLRASGASR